MPETFFHPDLPSSLQDQLVETFTALGQSEIGFSFSAWRNGSELVSWHDGWLDKTQQQAWTSETLAPVWSATKGPMAATLLLALSRCGLDPESEVQRIWPELSLGSTTIGELLSHQCGLAALDQAVSIWDREAVIHALESQSPNWSPGHHGYHTRTIGFLADELVRRLDGRSLGRYWHDEIATPHQLDFFIGCPSTEHHRVATLIPARPDQGGQPREFYQAFLQPDSLTKRAFSSPRGLSAISEMNSPTAWEAGLPAMGGLGSAKGLARFYQTLLQGELRDWLPHFTQRLSNGLDLVQRVPTAFSFGMMLDPLDESGQKIRHLFGPTLSAFGHPGAGGSYGFLDPTSSISCAFVMNHFEANLYPSPARLNPANLILQHFATRSE